jgi:hypothetical protein
MALDRLLRAIHSPFIKRSSRDQGKISQAEGRTPKKIPWLGAVSGSIPQIYIVGSRAHRIFRPEIH